MSGAYRSPRCRSSLAIDVPVGEGSPEIERSHDIEHAVVVDVRRGGRPALGEAADVGRRWRASVPSPPRSCSDPSRRRLQCLAVPPADRATAPGGASIVPPPGLRGAWPPDTSQSDSIHGLERQRAPQPPPPPPARLAGAAAGAAAPWPPASHPVASSAGAAARRRTGGARRCHLTGGTAGAGSGPTHRDVSACASTSRRTARGHRR